jgi:hypothetical protein
VPAHPATPPPSRYASPAAPSDPIFANRPIATLPPAELSPPGYPPARRTEQPAPPAAGAPLDLAPPRPYSRPGLRPPACVATAALFDPTVTGSTNNRRFYKDGPAPDRTLPAATPGED